MLIKILGGGLLLISATIYGINMGYGYDQRIKGLKEMQKMIEIIQGDLMFNKLPFSASLKRIVKRNEGVFAFYFSKISELMEIENMSMSEAWIKSTLQCKEGFKRMYLADKDMEFLQQMGEELVCSNENSLIEVFGHYIDELKKMIKSLENNRDNKVKIYRTMGAVMGIFLIIIMV